MRRDRRGRGDSIRRALSYREWRRKASAGGLWASLCALGLYAAIAIFVTWPVAARLSSVIAGFEGRDGWQYTWSLWWAKSALFERGVSPAHLSLLNHPEGFYHPFQLSLIYVSLVSLPFSLFLPPAAVYNLMVLISFALSGLTAYWLCLELVAASPKAQSQRPDQGLKHKLAAFVGGLIFAFAPNRLGHVLAGWLPQMTVYLFPLFALCLWRALRRPTLRNGVFLGVVTAPALLVHVMHVAYFVAPLTLVVLGQAWYRYRGALWSRARLRAVGVGLLIAAGFSLPLLAPLLVGRVQGEMTYLYTGDITGHSTDLLAFFTPSPFHPVLSRLGLVPGFAQRAFPEEEWLRSALAYPGLIGVLLAAWGVRRSSKRGRAAIPWLVLALGAAVLSLGPLLIVGRETVTCTVDNQVGRVVMPYSLLRLIPYYDLGRTPGRLNATGMLALGVLASWGLADLLYRVRAKGRLLLLTGALSGLIVFEFLPLWPFPAGDATTPPVIQAIQQTPGEGALLHVPMSRRRVNHRGLYFQSLTGRPIVGGEVHRPHPATPPWYETIVSLVESTPDGDIVPRLGAVQRRAWLQRLDVDFVLYHKLEAADAPFYRPAIEATLGKATWEDEGLAAWAVSTGSSPPSSSTLYALSQRGWLDPQQTGSGWQRWLVEDGRMYVYLDGEAPQVGRLRFDLAAASPFSRLDVYLDGEPLDQFVVDRSLLQISRPFSLQPGMNVFRFRAPDGCLERVAHPGCWGDETEETYPCDPAALPVTCRSFLFQDVRFVTQGLEMTPVDAVLGEAVRLRGAAWDEQAIRPGDTLTLTLYWQALTNLPEDYTVFVHLLDVEGQLVAQHDSPPANGRHPTSTWQAGETFGYTVTLQVPDTLTRGRYTLSVGMYRWPSLERLDLPGDADDVITLGDLEIR